MDLAGFERMAFVRYFVLRTPYVNFQLEHLSASDSGDEGDFLAGGTAYFDEHIATINTP